jgi:hypothetical protein
MLEEVGTCRGGGAVSTHQQRGEDPGDRQCGSEAGQLCEALRIKVQRF